MRDEFAASKKRPLGVSLSWDMQSVSNGTKAAKNNGQPDKGRRLSRIHSVDFTTSGLLRGAPGKAPTTAHTKPTSKKKKRSKKRRGGRNKSRCHSRNSGLEDIGSVLTRGGYTRMEAAGGGEESTEGEKHQVDTNRLDLERTCLHCYLIGKRKDGKDKTT